MQDFIEWLQQVGLENILWITDVDETLLEKSTDPNKVTQIPGLEQLCENLNLVVGGGFCVITGRDFEWLDKVFPRKNVPASCEYHSLFRAEAGAEPKALNPVPQWHLIDAELDALTAKHDGLIMRKKQFMRTLHYSAVPAEQRQQVVEAVGKELEKLLDRHNAETGQSVGITDGGKVFDMGPSNSDKSDALRDILQQAQQKTGRKLIPIYFGDSPGDLPGADAVWETGGKFISVGDDERVTDVANFKLRDPAEYRAVIQKTIDMAAALKKSPAPVAFRSPGSP